MKHNIGTRQRGIGGVKKAEAWGETSRSWIVAGIKFPKNNPRGVFTDQQREDAIWKNDNRCKIVDRVERCPGSVLRKILALLDEEEKGSAL